jgi:hypothetical protein
MDQLFNVVTDIYTWAKKDFKEWPLRFFFEVLAWMMSIGCAITMSMTVPNPPFLILYPLFITQCCIFAWAAYTRRSFGMIGNYVLLVTIDSVALIRLVLQQVSPT